MGLMSRNKGKRFEREIAAMLRLWWPDAVIRRASQAERADNPDVFLEGGPPVLSRLWLELQDARNPRPLEKLEQAEGDAARWLSVRAQRAGTQHRYPVVVWHRLHEKSTQVTTRHWVLGELAGWAGYADLFHRRVEFAGAMVVTVDLGEFLGLLGVAS